MPDDAWTKEFDREFGPRASKPGQPREADPWIDAFDRAFGATKKAARIGGEVAAEVIPNVVGSVAGLAGSALSYPKAAAIKAISGNTTPLKFEPTASLKQLEEIDARLRRAGMRPFFSPLSLDIASDIPAAGAANIIGGSVLRPLGRAAANLEIGRFRARAIPGVKGTLEFFKPGASLPNRIRDEFYKTLRSAEGAADWRAFVRGKAFDEALDLPPAVQDKIADAIERRAIGFLPPEQRDVANALVSEFSEQVSTRKAAGLKPWELRATEGGPEFVPRVMTQEERVRRYGKYGSPFEPPSRLGTGRMARRSQFGRERTTEEVTQAVRPGERIFEPVVKGAMIRGGANDVRVMHADVLRELADKFGKPAASGEKTMGQLRGALTGFDDATQAKLSTTALPKELNEVVEGLNASLQPREWSKTNQRIRWVNDQFRKWALFSPGFISRNWQNNAAQAVVFGSWHPGDWTRSFNLVRRWNSAKSIKDLSPKDAAMLEEAIRGGVIGRGFASEMGRGVTESKWNLFAKSRDVNQAGEDVSRLAYYLMQRSRGKGTQEAAQMVDNVFFNYSPRFQSAGFQAVRRNAIPFINWQSNIPQLAVRTAIQRPGSLGFIEGLRQKINYAQEMGLEEEKGLPQHIQEQAPVKTRDGRYFLPQGYGTYDVNTMLTAPQSDIRKLSEYVKRRSNGEDPASAFRAVAGYAKGSDTAQELASRMYPQWALLYAAASGRDPLSGWGIRDPERYFSGVMPQFRWPLLVRDVAQGKPGAKDRLLSAMIGVRFYEPLQSR